MNNLPFTPAKFECRARWLVRSLFIIHCSLFIALTARAQYVSNGTDPDYVRWSHIRNAHFDVIFPDSIRAQGEHFMRLLNRIYTPASASLNHFPRRVPVILHPYNLQSNGMVVWVPSRMEIITTAPSDGYGQPWLEQLALHEFRHVVQTDMMNRGFTRGLYYLLGEQAVAFPAALIQPWLFEGDAVSTETAMSHTGRGRMPSFSMGLRTIALSGKKYSYDKYLLGSYKDYIPNHYEYGYQVTAYGRYKYGADLWGKVFRYTGNFPFLIFPQSIATKKYTGKNSKNFHKEAKLFIDSLWRAQQPLSVDNPVQLVKNDSFTADRFVDYANLVVLSDDRIFAQRKQLSRTSMLVEIGQSKRARKLSMLGNVSSKLTGVRNSILWTEYRPDVRWEQKNYSELWRYNTKRKRKQRLTFGTAYFTPTVNDSLQVAVSEKHLSGEQSILVFDSALQHREELLRFPVGKSVNDLAWIDSEHLAVLYTAAQGRSIGMLNVRARAMETLLPFTYAEVEDLSVRKGRVFFSSGYDGINNLYAVEVQGKSVYKLTSATYGAFNPRLSADGNRLFYVDYTVQGGKPVALHADSMRWEKTTFDSPRQLHLTEIAAQQENFLLDTARLDTAPLAVKRYSKLAHLFRLHSWAPFAFSSSDIIGGDFSSAAVGITLMSQNNLSSAASSLGYKYQNGFSSVNASYTYSGWYPVFQLSGSYGKRYGRVYDYAIGNLYSSNEHFGELHAAVYVPFNLSRGNVIASLIPSMRYSFSNDGYRFSMDESFRREQAFSLGISHALYTRMAERDINPRWGYRLSGSLLNDLFRLNSGLAQQWNAEGNVYLPGILYNHSLRLYGGYERQRQPILYTSQLVLPRGAAADLTGLGFERARSLSFNYAFPLWYPDLSLGLLAYIKRLRVNLFYDDFLGDMLEWHEVSHFTGYDGVWKRVDRQTRSAGYEAIFDAHVFRFSIPMLSIGWRQSFVQAPARRYNNVELLLNFSY